MYIFIFQLSKYFKKEEQTRNHEYNIKILEAKLSANNDEIKSRTDSINNLENLIKNYRSNSNTQNKKCKFR